MGQQPAQRPTGHPGQHERQLPRRGGRDIEQGDRVLPTPRASALDLGRDRLDPHVGVVELHHDARVLTVGTGEVHLGTLPLAQLADQTVPTDRIHLVTMLLLRHGIASASPPPGRTAARGRCGGWVSVRSLT